MPARRSRLGSGRCDTARAPPPSGPPLPHFPPSIAFTGSLSRRSRGLLRSSGGRGGFPGGQHRHRPCRCANHGGSPCYVCCRPLRRDICRSPVPVVFATAARTGRPTGRVSEPPCSRRHVSERFGCMSIDSRATSRLRPGKARRTALVSERRVSVWATGGDNFQKRGPGRPPVCRQSADT